MAPKTHKKRKDANPLPWVVLVLALITGGIWLVSRNSGGSHHAIAADEKVEIHLSLPQPPPPPPPPQPKVEQPPPDDEQMVLQEPVPDDEQPPDDPAPEPPPGLDLDQECLGVMALPPAREVEAGPLLVVQVVVDHRVSLVGMLR